MLEKIQKILMERYEQIEVSYQHYQNNPFDSVRAHTLRVELRKLRALINVVKPLIITEAYDLANLSLRQASHIYEDLREVDVLIELCAAVSLEKPDLSDHYYELFNYLINERRKEMRRTLTKTNLAKMDLTLNETRHFIEQLTTHVEADKMLESKEEWSAYITKRIKKKNKKMLKRYQELDMTDYESIHQTRLVAKKLRYAATFLGKLTTVDVSKMAKRAKSIQSEFGDITDSHVNSELLDQYAQKTDKPELKRLLNEIRLSELEQLDAN